MTGFQKSKNIEKKLEISEATDCGLQILKTERLSMVRSDMAREGELPRELGSSPRPCSCGCDVS
eukprot:scaffold52599_cov37-Tisochrysis_lutea.AAC.4